MATDDLWITTRTAEAHKHHPAVTDAVLAQVQKLLKDKLGDHQLTQGELGTAAKALIDDMGSTSSKAEPK